MTSPVSTIPVLETKLYIPKWPAGLVTRARLIVNEAWRRVRRQLGRLREYPDNDVRVVAAEVLASGGAYLPGRRPGE